MSGGDEIDAMQDLHPEQALSRTACSKALTKHILSHPDSKVLLKKKHIVVQATTIKRSATTHEQQWRHNAAVDSALSMLRECNAGLRKLLVKSFGELIRHSILGGDDA